MKLASIDFCVVVLGTKSTFTSECVIELFCEFEFAMDLFLLLDVVSADYSG